MGIGLSSAQLKAVATFVTGKEFGGERDPQDGHTAPVPAPAHRQAAGRTALERMGCRPGESSLSTRRDGAHSTAAEIPRLKLKWAFAFPGVSRAHGSSRRWRADGCSSAAPIARFTRSTRPPAASTGTSRPISPSAPQSLVGPVGAVVGRLLRRPGRERLRGRRGHRKAALEDARRRFPGRDHHRRAQAPRRTPVRPGVVRRRKSSARSPNYECCKFRGSVVALDAATGKQIWKAYTIAEPAAARPQERRGRPACGAPPALASGRLPTIDVKKRALYVSTGDSYSEPAAQDQRRLHRLRSRNGQATLVAPVHRRATRSTSRAAVPRR